MAILRLDGQDHYDTAHQAKKWTTVDSTNVTWTTTSNGAGGKHCLERTQTSAGASGFLEAAGLMLQSGPWTPTVSGICGFKVYVNALSKLTTPAGAGNPSDSLIGIMSGGNYHLALQLHPNGTFELVRAGFGGTTLGTSTEGLRDAEWMTVEMKWVISDTSGSVAVTVNNMPVMTVAGVPTKNLGIGPSTWNSVKLLQSNAASSGATTLNMRLMDFYVADLSGGANEVKDFQGNWNFVTIVADGVGNYAAWTPSAGANWQNTKEIPPDDDTTYNATTTVGNRDSFTFQNLPAGTVVLAFQTVFLARLTAAGVAGIKPTMRTGGVDYDANELGLSQTSYDAFKMQAYDKSPATGVKATEAEINGAEFGVLKST